MGWRSFSEVEDMGAFAEVKLWRVVKLMATQIAHGRSLFGEYLGTYRLMTP